VKKKKTVATGLATLLMVALVAPVVHARNLANNPVNLDQRSPLACNIINGDVDQRSSYRIDCDE
jgi:hypothetical protein